jgi:hypothetical protein
LQVVAVAALLERDRLERLGEIAETMLGMLSPVALGNQDFDRLPNSSGRCSRIPFRLTVDKPDATVLPDDNNCVGRGFEETRKVGFDCLLTGERLARVLCVSQAWIPGRNRRRSAMGSDEPHRNLS